MQPSGFSQLKISSNELINLLIEADYSKDSIKIKREGISLIKPEELNDAIKFFVETIQSNLKNVDEASLITAMEKLQHHVQKLVESSSNKTKYNPALGQLFKLTHQVAISHWKGSNQSINKVISDIPFHEKEKNELVGELEDACTYLDKNKHLILLDNTLLINREFFLENDKYETTQKLNQIIQSNPSIEFIQIQGDDKTIEVKNFERDFPKTFGKGYIFLNNLLLINGKFIDEENNKQKLINLINENPSLEYIQITDLPNLIDRDSLKKFLSKEDFSIRMLSSICSFNLQAQFDKGEPKNIIINPELIANSEFLYNSLSFNNSLSEMDIEESSTATTEIEPEESTSTAFIKPSNSPQSALWIPISFETMQMLNN